jgi:ATP-dependent RNA helicase RhlE
MTFSELGVDATLCERLKARQIVEPTPIQKDSYQAVFEKATVLGFAQTGTGKTLAYLIPLVGRLDAQPLVPGTHKVFVLVPTRELASQVARDLDLLTGSQKRGVVIVGGESERDQIDGAQQADWVIATPGRLLDLLKKRILNPAKPCVIVFDEADRLLDMGFVDDMRDIVNRLPEREQLLFFSATINLSIEEMAYEFGTQNIVRVGEPSKELTVEGLKHRVSYVGEEEKFHALVSFLKKFKNGRGIVFSNYRDKAGVIANRLKGLGARAEPLTAQLSQAARTQILEQFRSGRVQVLTASDLAARGLDITDLDFVVNYDIPEDPATYVHRVGRTARAGKEGEAVSFVGYEDSFHLEKLERFLGTKIERYDFSEQELKGPLGRLTEAPRREPQPQRTANPPRQQPAAPRPSGPPSGPKPAVKSQAPAKAHVSIWMRIRQTLAGLVGLGPKVEEPRVRSVSRVAPQKSSDRRRGQRHSRNKRHH